MTDQARKNTMDQATSDLSGKNHLIMQNAVRIYTTLESTA